MKGILGFTYAIFSYAVAFVALLYWIASTGNLLPHASIDGEPVMATHWAILNNLGLVLLFGIQHSVMARTTFKDWICRYIPTELERSTYTLSSGILLAILVYFWQPLGGTIWSVKAGTGLYYALFGGYFLGWGILFVSTFLINHFDLFGLRQGYLYMKGIPYTPLQFKMHTLYKIVRHPLYLGAVMGIWITPNMTVTHLFYAILLTGYILVGIYFEELGLIEEFGDTYREYRRKVPKLIPLLRFSK